MEISRRNASILLLAIVLLASFAAVSARAQQVGADYVVGTGDSLNIQVYGEPDLSFDALPILDEGVVVMPLIGEVRTVGKTVRNLESEITQRLADGYLINPRVSVSIAEYRPFFLVGEVRNPGEVRYVADMNVRRALVLGGGLTDNGDPSKIRIERASGDVVASATEETSIYPGDIVSVGSRDRVSVRGAVQYPETLAFQSGTTLEEAIALAGGFTADADRESIMLERGGQVANVAGNLATELQSGDIITVNYLGQAEGQAAAYIFIKGEVQRGGRYEFVPGLTVEQAVVLAGGFSARASQRKIEIRRAGDPPITMNRVDLTARVLPGDVITVGASIF